MNNFDYSGKEELSIMSHAKNYNNTIFAWITRNLSQHKTILDFGSGIGEFCNRLKEKNIYALEPDIKQHRFLQLDKARLLTKINSKKDRFDLIYTINVLEHIEDDAKAIDDLLRLLTPGGILKIFVPARQEIFSKMDASIGHFRRYSKKRLQTICAQKGITIVELKYFDFLGYFLSFLFKYLSSSGKLNKRAIILYDKLAFPISRFFDIVTCGKIIGKNLLITLEKNI